MEGCKMTVRRHNVEQPTTDESRRSNLAALKEGVEGLTCTLSASIGKQAKISEDLMQKDDGKLMLPGEYIVGVECYEDGSLNLYVRNKHGRNCAYLIVRHGK